MDGGHKASMACVLIVAFHKHFSSFIVEGGFGEGNDEKAANDLEDVGEGGCGGPGFGESVDTDGANIADVGVEDFGEEEAAGWLCWVFFAKHELDSKHTAFVGSGFRSSDVGKDLRDVAFGWGVRDALRGLRHKRFKLFVDASHNLGGKVLVRFHCGGG